MSRSATTHRRKGLKARRTKRQKGKTLFFTVATQQRRNLLLRAPVLQALRESFAEIQLRNPFTLNAWVILPDHLHCIWTLPTSDGDFLGKWDSIRAAVTRRVIDCENFIPARAIACDRRREELLWQRQVLAQPILSPRQLNRRMEYIHYNPVKHGLVESARAWRFSSFHHFVERGLYSPAWDPNEDPEVNERV